MALDNKHQDDETRRKAKRLMEWAKDAKDLQK
jgi:hypothetical protein